MRRSVSFGQITAPYVSLHATKRSLQIRRGGAWWHCSANRRTAWILGAIAPASAQLSKPVAPKSEHDFDGAIHQTPVDVSDRSGIPDDAFSNFDAVRCRRWRLASAGENDLRPISFDLRRRFSDPEVEFVASR